MELYLLDVEQPAGVLERIQRRERAVECAADADEHDVPGVYDGVCTGVHAKLCQPGLAAYHP